MCCIGRSLSHPAAQYLDLCLRELLAGFERRHAIVRIRGSDASDHLTLFGSTGHNGDLSGLSRLQCFLANIEPQLRLALIAVGAMAFIAILAQDWADIAVEIDLVRAKPGCVRRRCGSNSEGKKCNQQRQPECTALSNRCRKD